MAVIGAILDVTNVRVLRAAAILGIVLTANAFVIALSNQGRAKGVKPAQQGESFAALFFLKNCNY